MTVEECGCPVCRGIILDKSCSQCECGPLRCDGTYHYCLRCGYYYKIKHQKEIHFDKLVSRILKNCNNPSSRFFGIEKVEMK